MRVRTDILRLGYLSG